MIVELTCNSAHVDLCGLQLDGVCKRTGEAPVEGGGGSGEPVGYDGTEDEVGGRACPPRPTGSHAQSLWQRRSRQRHGGHRLGGQTNQEQSGNASQECG